MAPVLFLLGLGPFARWKEAALPDILRSLRWAFVVGVVLAIILPLVYGQWHPMTALGLLLAGWIAASVVINFIGRVRQTRGADSFITAALRQPRSFFGMHLAHLGVAVFVIGVTMVMSFEEEKDVKLDAGEAVTVADYTFTFVGVHEVEGPNYVAYRGQFTVRQGDRALRTLLPEKRNYFTFVERADGRMERRISGMPMTEAAIDAGLWRDVYVSLGEPIDSDKPEGAWAVRVYHKPFVDWIWGGCLLMALGGLFAMLDRRDRPKARRAAHPFAGSQPA
jgi:cytochrome c-type biogenesis protein CcmF